MKDFELALNQAISFFGNQRKMASALHINNVTISYWKSCKQKVNIEKAVMIEYLTKGLVKWHELAPEKAYLNKLIEVKYGL